MFGSRLDEESERDKDELLDAYLSSGASVIQLRLKQSPTRRFIDWAKEARARCMQANILCIVNDRADIAALIEADGVHLGQSDVLTATATEEHLGGSIANYAVRIVRADGSAVAFFRGVVYRKKQEWGVNDEL